MNPFRPSLSQVCQNPFDLLIVGGGINGAGTAREAAGRGLKVLLVEQCDFAFGASSRSTKLVHGGLRYLEHGSFGLVAESLKERRVLCEVLAPHLTRPVPFLVPVYAGDDRPAWLIRAGLYLYDFLALKGRGFIHAHRWLNANRALALVPNLGRGGLRGGAEYWDCQMDDARVTLENLQDARNLGASTLNYCSLRGADGLEDGDIRVRLRDEENGQESVVRARLLVLAAGAWTDQVFERLGLSVGGPKVHATKGVHLVTRRLIDTHALLVPSRSDRRVFFVVPWELEGRAASLIGTTDSDFSGDPAHVRAEEEEISYLLSETARVLPRERLGRADVWATYAGLRPLSAPRRSGRGNASVSREHTFWEQPGVLAVTGGKFTTYRALCESMVERAAQRLGEDLPASLSTRNPLPGAPRPGEAKGTDLALALGSATGLDSATASLLVGHYGRLAWDVAALVREKPQLGDLIEPGSGCPAPLAMATWAARREQAVHLDDFYLRRTRLGLRLEPGHPGAKRVAAVMGEELGWDEGRRQREWDRLGHLVRDEYR